MNTGYDFNQEKDKEILLVPYGSSYEYVIFLYRNEWIKRWNGNNFNEIVLEISILDFHKLILECSESYCTTKTKVVDRRYGLPDWICKHLFGLKTIIIQNSELQTDWLYNHLESNQVLRIDGKDIPVKIENE